MNQSKYGRKAEERVAGALRSRGARVKVSPGSRGAADIKAVFPTGTKWNIQVKASRSGKPHSLSRQEVARLKKSAAKDRATPVVASVSRGRTEYCSARSGRKLSPPKKK